MSGVFTGYLISFLLYIPTVNGIVFSFDNDFIKISRDITDVDGGVLLGYRNFRY